MVRAAPGDIQGNASLPGMRAGWVNPGPVPAWPCRLLPAVPSSGPPHRLDAFSPIYTPGVSQSTHCSHATSAAPQRSSLPAHPPSTQPEPLLTITALPRLPPPPTTPPGLQHPRGTRDGTQDPDSTLADTTRKPASTREGQQPPASKKAQTSDAEDRYRQPSLDTAHPHTSRDQQQQQQHPTPLSPSARGGRSFSGGSAFRSLNSTAPSQGLRSGGSCSGGGGALCHTMSLREAAAGHAPAGTGSCSGPVSGQQHTCPLSGHAAWHGTEWWRRFSSSRLNELAQEEPDPHSPEMRRVPFTGGASPMCALVHGEERQEATSTSA